LPGTKIRRRIEQGIDGKGHSGIQNKERHFLPGLKAGIFVPEI
jgi:hypothetical protein